MYYARKRLKIGYAFREAGEPVPEASGWTNLAALIAGGYLDECAEEPSVEQLHEVLLRSNTLPACPESAPTSEAAELEPETQAPISKPKARKAAIPAKTAAKRGRLK